MKTAEGIAGYLSAVAQMSRMTREESHPDWRFHSIEELVLHYGRPFSPAPRPADVPQMTLGECYFNAMLLVRRDPELTYVEGYAYSKIYPMAHGWATADSTTAIDPTWDNSEDYYGIPFTNEFWTDYVKTFGQWGIFFAEFPTDGVLAMLRFGIPEGALA